MKSNLSALAWRNIRSRRLRSWLTVVGILIGVMAIVALIAIGAGVDRSLLKEFRTIGFDVLLLVPRTGLQGGPEVAQGSGAAKRPVPAQIGSGTTSDRPDVSIEPVTPRDIGEASAGAALQEGYELVLDRIRAVPSVASAGVIDTVVRTAKVGSQPGFLRVASLSSGVASEFSGLLGGFSLNEGEICTWDDNRIEVVIGHDIAKRASVGAGDVLLLDGHECEITGVLAPSAALSSGAWVTVISSPAITPPARDVIDTVRHMDGAVFMPYEASQHLWPGQLVSTIVAVRVIPGANMTRTAAEIEEALVETRIAMSPISTQELADNVQRALATVRIVLASVAGIALIVGSIAMANTMYTAVLERTREIGVLKAIGARDRQVLALFLIDSGIMGLLGGILGLIAGAGLSFAGTGVVAEMLDVSPFRPVFSPALVVGVLGLSFLLGACAGAWPAWHAARMDPVRALASQ